ncbi:hypothetical protein [Oscillatoria salina]|uniref:hypothetical protein n=1 Tax=Oscillatoria salina TaxID=331517 RepID=UPI0013B9114E|nr:hypothetical protein [Oscillatoria salina]MBZ8179424.1 hypothetical protein [Oscillatoria salina IIICB1]NET87836.1 hypothetical protein [Kamptonema sp. SIO1D9]
MEDFGVIIACCYQDYLFAKGCCASVRHFLGDVPLCLLVDGSFPVDSLVNVYGVKVINHQNVSNQILRQRSFGWGKTKMVAFWESPWQHFLMLDADTNVWGDVLKYANFQDYDVVIDRPNYGYPDSEIIEFFFDIEGVEKHFPDFNWQVHRDKYFCTGTFFATRDIFSLDEYIEILDFTEKYPHIFKYGEMGFLNFMLFRAADAGKIRLGQADMQIIVPDYDRNDLKKRFPVTETGPVVENNEAKVIHWCGPKPLLATKKAYADPMSFCRRQFLDLEKGLSGNQADLALRWEDSYSTFIKYKNKARKKIKKFFGAKG